MARIVFQAIAKEPVEVEVLGSLFVLQPLTRSVQKKLDDNNAKLAGLTESDGYDGIVDMICGALDHRLSPSTGQTKVSTVLQKAWKADEIDHRWLVQFLDQLNDADRPT